MILSWVEHEPLTKGDYVYPLYANAIGWIIAMIAILATPAVAIYQIIHKVCVEHRDEDNIIQVICCAVIYIIILVIIYFGRYLSMH